MLNHVAKRSQWLCSYKRHLTYIMTILLHKVSVNYVNLCYCYVKLRIHYII